MEPYKYHIQRATAADAVNLTGLAKKGFPGYPFESVYQPDSLAAAIAEGEHRIVALLQPELQRIIGTAVLGVDGLMAEVKRVIVDPDYRNNGLAREMTRRLVNDATELQVNPYTDTRADQIGMQRASLAAGLLPITVEAGKHVVFEHENHEHHATGPARESMIHMTSLRADPERLYAGLRGWSRPLRATLVDNVEKALHNPPEKMMSSVAHHLPSARAVREHILKELETQRNGFHILHDEQDVTVLSHGSVRMVVIKPDASGFLETNGETTREELEYLLRLSKNIGLQIVTGYEAADDPGKAELLRDCGMEPAMIRPWQKKRGEEPDWQVGFRKVMNGYGNCLHRIDIDRDTRRQLEEFATTLKRSIL